MPLLIAEWIQSLENHSFGLLVPDQERCGSDRPGAMRFRDEVSPAAHSPFAGQTSLGAAGRGNRDRALPWPTFRLSASYPRRLSR